jgi:3-oxoacyl-[acyl-carrier-protein] synthase-1
VEKRERIDMIYKVSDNIISALGFSSQENYQAVKAGKSQLQLYENVFGISEPFVASLLDNHKIDKEFATLSNIGEKYTKLEKTAILSASKALENSGIDPSNDNVLFIFSTTKGNVELLERNDRFESERIHLWRSAELIAQFFKNKNEPIVVSNACISGVAAQITAARYLIAKRYQYIVVIGAEVLSKFIVSGFQSFKALSSERCSPFDRNRTGLNLGEAAATVIYSVSDMDNLPPKSIIFENGAICNDANHISGPSRTGEGLFNAISKAMRHIDKENISFINAHGTATSYNDDMESMAIGRYGLENVPVNSLKAYFGHTLGAAGIVETIISMYALQENIILKSLGTEEAGVVYPITINREIMKSDKNAFLKLISGFGGSNAAMILKKNK